MSLAEVFDTANRHKNANGRMETLKLDGSLTCSDIISPVGKALTSTYLIDTAGLMALQVPGTAFDGVNMLSPQSCIRLIRVGNTVTLYLSMICEDVLNTGLESIDYSSFPDEYKPFYPESAPKLWIVGLNWNFPDAYNPSNPVSIFFESSSSYLTFGLGTWSQSGNPGYVYGFQGYLTYQVNYL